uniref:Nuclear pore complex protein Nup50 n=1 Tax=Nothobranchius pienaari TaxID=704102 RepID=A0A1A8RBH3_9TELE
MAKRIADKELTDRNWDQEDEGEEAGTFSIASEDVLKNRAIKKAKRRNPGAEGDSGAAFRGFKGFSAAPSAIPAPFSGFGKAGSFEGFGLTNGGSKAPYTGVSSATVGLTFNGPHVPPTADITTRQTNGSSPSSTQSNKEYRRQLTALNCSVRDWITKHVNENPLCDLNPIFRDYERHLSSIEQQHGGGEAADGGSETPPPSAALFSFSRTTSEDLAQKVSGTAPVASGITFNFGQKVDSSVLGSLRSKSAASSFAFSSSSQTSIFGAPGPAALPPFGGTKPDEAADENGDEESEEPPKPEVKEVKEDDAFYSKKCKLFYKKEAEFKEKGVGTLHLKNTSDGKIQMIIRADTNLGNILLNIIVQHSMPCSRVGKNNVMVVCVPNPPIHDKNPSGPVPLLIRVKTDEDADELHKILEERKG